MAPRVGAPSNNPRGRPPGIKGVTEHTLLFVAPKDMVDAITFARAIMRCPQASDTVRQRACESLMRYENSPPDRKASTALNLPAATTVEIARGNIQIIKLNYDLGRIGADEMAARISAEEASIRALLDTELEADFRTIEGIVERQTITAKTVVSGGLPRLPGAESMLAPDVSAPENPGPWEPET
jgi:hypothetical protein